MKLKTVKPSGPLMNYHCVSSVPNQQTNVCMFTTAYKVMYVQISVLNCNVYVYDDETAVQAGSNVKDVAVQSQSHLMAVLLLHIKSSSDSRVKDSVILSAAY